MFILFIKCFPVLNFKKIMIIVNTVIVLIIWPGTVLNALDILIVFIFTPILSDRYYFKPIV